MSLTPRGPGTMKNVRAINFVVSHPPAAAERRISRRISLYPKEMIRTSCREEEAQKEARRDKCQRRIYVYIYTRERVYSGAWKFYESRLLCVCARGLFFEIQRPKRFHVEKSFSRKFLPEFPPPVAACILCIFQHPTTRDKRAREFRKKVGYFLRVRILI